MRGPGRVPATATVAAVDGTAGAPPCLRRSAAVVAGRQERHGADFHRHGLAAHDRVHHGAGCRELRRHIAHGDGLVQARAQQAAGHFADGRAVGALQGRVLAHGHALARHQAHAAAGQQRGVVDLRQHLAGAGEAACPRAAGAPHLLDGPVQRGLGGRGGGVDVVAVEAQAGFQPQRIACAEADGLHLGLGQQRARQRLGLGGGHGDLEAVLARVAAARHIAVAAGDLEPPAGHEHQRCRAGREPRERRSGLRALQGEQRLVGQGDDLAAAADAFLDVGDVAGLAGAVHDHEQVVAAVHEHQVVDDAALVVQQQAVALLVQAEADHVHGDEGLEGRGGVGACEAQLAHVGDVEQAGGLPRVQVFGHQTGGVLHGHGVAGEGHHAGPEFEVQRVQRRGVQGGGFGGHGRSGLSGEQGRTTRVPPSVAPRLCPLSALPERFTTPCALPWGRCVAGLAPSVGLPSKAGLSPAGETPASLRAPCQSFCLSVRGSLRHRRRRPPVAGAALSPDPADSNGSTKPRGAGEAGFSGGVPSTPVRR